MNSSITLQFLQPILDLTSVAILICTRDDVLASTRGLWGIRARFSQITHKKDSTEATSEATPQTTTVARVSLTPVPLPL